MVFKILGCSPNWQNLTPLFTRNRSPLHKRLHKSSINLVELGACWHKLWPNSNIRAHSMETYTRCTQSESLNVWKLTRLVSQHRTILQDEGRLAQPKKHVGRLCTMWEPCRDISCSVCLQWTPLFFPFLNGVSFLISTFPIAVCQTFLILFCKRVTQRRSDKQ